MNIIGSISFYGKIQISLWMYTAEAWAFWSLLLAIAGATPSFVDLKSIFVP